MQSNIDFEIYKMRKKTNNPTTLTLYYAFHALDPPPFFF